MSAQVFIMFRNSFQSQTIFQIFQQKKSINMSDFETAYFNKRAPARGSANEKAAIRQAQVDWQSINNGPLCL